jgi:AcrR family transcriptional regulator
VVEDVTVADAVPADDNRLRIVRAAERLMAAHGIDGVSLREINREARQGNASAIQYHFGGRDQLLLAVLDRHQAFTDPRRHALLDACEAAGEAVELRDLAAALVVPLVERLSDPDGGRDYVQVACEFYSRARSVADLGENHDPRSSMVRWHRLVADRLPEQEERLFPSRYPAVRLTIGEVARRAQDPPRTDDDAWAATLTDLVSALLAAPTASS